MALTYRSPLEENVAAYDSSVQGVIASTSANYYRDMESNNFQFFNFHLSPVAKKKLIEAGIYLSPYSALPHSHPVCKTLENNILYNVLPSLVDNSFYFVGIKNFKLDLLKLRNSKLSMLNKICRYVTSLDKVRYGNEFVVRSSPPIPGLKRHCGHIDGPTLKGLVPEVIARSAKKLFLHDELHYWDHRDLISFLEAVKPDVLYASVVYPPELLQGATSSLNKWCYSFEVVGRDFVFYPDGVHGEGYQQPLKCGYILKAKTITLGDDEVYHVDVVSSKFAHHLVAITRGRCLGPTVRSFGPFEATSCRGLEPVVRDVQHCFPISFEVVSRVYRYLRTLKKPDAQSAMAKLSQLLPEPTGIEIKFLQDFADLVIGTSTINTMIKPARAKIFFGGWLRKMPKILVSRFNVVKELSLDEFISYMEPYHFQVELVDVSWNYAHALDLYSMAEADFGVDVVKLVDDRFIYGTSAELIDRMPQQYTSLLPFVDRRGSLVSVPTAALEHFCCAVLLSEIFNPFLREISLAKAKEAVLRRIAHSCSLIMPKKLLMKHVAAAGFMIKIIRKLRSRYHKYLKLDHTSYPLLWFLDHGRGYQKYLTGYVEGKYLAPEWHNIYGTCVLAFKLGQLPALRKRLIPINYAGKDYFEKVPYLCATVEPNSPTSQVEEDLGPMPGAPQPKMGASDSTSGVQRENLDCACGLQIAIQDLPLAGMHSFRTLEQLHNRHVGWYSKDLEGYTYNGGSHESLGWPEWLPVWMEINGIDNRYYNCCLYQVYAREGKIGFHADDEEIFVAGSSVCTVNLLGNAVFSIKCGKGCGKADLGPSMIFTMPEGFQETHKHAVGHASIGRSSLTFRRKKIAPKAETATVTEVEPNVGRDGDQREETESDPDTLGGHSSEGSTESTCDNSGATPVERSYGSLSYSKLPEGVFFSTTNVRGDGNCFWRVLELATGMAWVEIKKLVAKNPPLEKVYLERFSEQMHNGVYAESESMLSAAYTLHAKLIIYDQSTGQLVTIVPDCEVVREVYMHLENEHFQYLKPLNDCVLQAVSKAVRRQYNEIFHVYTKINGEEGLDADIWRKEGVALADLDGIFKMFDIEATVVCDGEAHLYNAGGGFKACFTLDKGHLDYNKKNPVVDVPILRGEIDALSVSSASICELRARGSTVPYIARRARGETLARSFLSGCTGVLNSRLFNDESSLVGKFLHDEQVMPTEVICLLGTFGAGKSTVFADFFSRNRAKGIFYVSPRRALADEFRRKIGLVSHQGNDGSDVSNAIATKKMKASQRNWHVLTFEIFLKRMHQVKPGMALLIDEVQLYPPGYLDLVLYSLPDGVHIIVGGDPCQSNYDNENDRAILVEEEQDAIKLLNGQEYNFNVLSKRFKNANFIGRLPCEIEPSSCTTLNEEHLLFTGLDEMCQVPKAYRRVFLVSSFEEKKIVESYVSDSKVKTLTFGESTGLNFKRGVILITNVSSAADDRRWITALSRFSENICFVNLVGTSWEFLAKSYRGRPLGQFLGKKASLEDLKALLPGSPSFCSGFNDRVGKDEGLKEEKAAGDPWLKGMIDLFQIEDVEEVEEQLEEIQEEWFKTHLPVAELESVRAGWVHKLLAKEFREVRMGYNVSEQFTDEYAKEKGKVLTNAAERFEAIYPRHRANDTVTFLMAVKKRLRFSRPATEKAKLVEAQAYGAFLLKEFLAKVPIKRGHNEAMMRQAKADFEEKKMSKSAATIENHSGRSCRDWLIDIGLIFSKSQLCTKFDNRFRVAKAAQSIVCFQHEVLCRFAPYMRYIEKKLHEALPSNYYIHSGKGLEELNDWVIKGRFDGVCTESDYEAFDASQDQYIVAFELAMMNYLGLPRDLIEDYKFIKTHLGSKLGNFAIMRFSGEASTFLFNTMANMLFTFLRYEIKGNEYICFAGDDMCASKRLIVKRAHEGFLKKLKLKAKVFMVEKPTFCGWHLSPDGIYKKPQLVLERMCIAKEKANLANCIDNYAIEVSFAYKMGERALNRMDEEEAAAFYNCVRIIIKNKHLLKSDIKNLYANLE